MRHLVIVKENKIVGMVNFDGIQISVSGVTYLLITNSISVSVNIQLIICKINGYIY